MNLKLTAFAVLSLIGGAALGALVLRPVVPPGGSYNAPPIGRALVGGPFSLVDQTGKRVTDQDFRGRYMLIYFGYTYCPDVCPASLQVISAALDRIGPDAGNVTPIFITIDPARDTPAKIGEYVKSFHPGFVGLTGSASEIAAVLKAYRVYAKKVPDEKEPSAYTMDHSSVVYLMGPDGDLVTFMADSTKVDTLATQLRKALAQKR